MGIETKIQWTHHTWSPWRGCSKVSPGCAHCYAEALSRRNPAVFGEWGPDGRRVLNADWRKPLAWDRAAAKAGERRRVFPSLCDPFEDRPELDDPRRRLARLIRDTPNLDWLMLTKRIEGAGEMIRRMWFPDAEWPENCWLGVSVEDQRRADERIPALLSTPAAVRFLSVEPLLGAIDLGLWRVASPKHREHWPAERVPNFWIIVGGESGPGARPCLLDWIRSIVRQCEGSGVACFVKQLGSRPCGNFGEPCPPVGHRHMPVAVRQAVGATSFLVFRDKKGGDWNEWPKDLRVREFPGPRRGDDYAPQGD